MGGIAEGARELAEVDPDDDDPSDGKLYAVELRLPPGEEGTYRFEATDVLGGVAAEGAAPLAGTPGPRVTDLPVAVAMPPYPSWPGKDVIVWARVFPGKAAGLTWRWELGDGGVAEG